MIKEFVFEQKGGQWNQFLNLASLSDIKSLQELYFHTFKYVISPYYCHLEAWEEVLSV